MLFTHGLCLDGISPRQAARRGVYATFEEQGRHNMNDRVALRHLDLRLPGAGYGGGGVPPITKTATPALH